MTKELKEIVELESFKEASKNRFWLKIASDGLGNPISVPIIVCKGLKDGPTLGLTAAIHGNELNGISVLQNLANIIQPEKLTGTIVMALAINTQGLLRHQREFVDGVDLNRCAPGREDGSVSQVYVYRVIEKLVKHFDYLLDLHTASFGRINSYYVRADLSDPTIAKLAELQRASIILNNEAGDHTLRGAADQLGIKSITIELNDPLLFQPSVVESSVTGLYNTLSYLGMYPGEIKLPQSKPIRCETSDWLYTDRGGILRVHVDLNSKVEKNQKIATITDIFGDKAEDVFSPRNGIVIGKSVNPVGQTGSRILHLGKQFSDSLT